MSNSHMAPTSHGLKKLPCLKSSTAAPALAQQQQHCMYGQGDSIPFLLCWSTGTPISAPLQGFLWEKGLHRASPNRWGNPQLQLFQRQDQGKPKGTSEKPKIPSLQGAGVKLHSSRNGVDTSLHSSAHPISASTLRVQLSKISKIPKTTILRPVCFGAEFWFL